MKDMIYGIGQNPMVEDWDEEDGEMDFSPFLVYISDLETWEKNNCCNDEVDEEIREIMSQAGFSETQEAVFEPTNSDIFILEDIHESMTNMGFLHDESFEEFMQSAFGE